VGVAVLVGVEVGRGVDVAIGVATGRGVGVSVGLEVGVSVATSGGEGSAVADVCPVASLVGDRVGAAVPVAAGEVAGVAVCAPSGPDGAPSSPFMAAAAHQLVRATTATTTAPMTANRSHRELGDELLPGCSVAIGRASPRDTPKITPGEPHSTGEWARHRGYLAAHAKEPGRNGQVLRPLHALVEFAFSRSRSRTRRPAAWTEAWASRRSNTASCSRFFAELSRYCRLRVTPGSLLRS